jgi:protein-S-isoprenylcysteine O-methyltransferase Ste14
MTDAPNRIPWPPVLFLAAIALALILHWQAALAWPGGVARFVLAAIGLCLIGTGLALDVAAFRQFRKHRTSILPTRAAASLIVEGPFARSRNPIYLGNTLVIFGAGLLFGVAWLLPAALVAAFSVQKLAIEREEAHLEASFGASWRDYAARTPRWLLWV